VEEALRLSKWKTPRVIIWQREQCSWHPLRKTAGERSWQNLVKSAKARGVKASCVPVKANDGVYVIYTSGTTGKPKGVLRENGGHAVGLYMTTRYIFGIQGSGHVVSLSLLVLYI
jgi:propionyl-CoA synthetase